MDNTPITTEEIIEEGKQVCVVHFSKRLRPLQVIRRGESAPIIRLPRGTRSSPVSRLDISSADARQMSRALTVAAEVAERMEDGR